MTNKAKQNPCPFCGSTDQSHTEVWDMDKDQDREIVECNNCLATAPIEVWDAPRVSEKND